MQLKCVATVITALALALPAAAQQIDLPRPSPTGKVSQTAGLTEITVEYSSPAVHGRPIWGALVPYGEVWRAGANATTKVTFSKDVTIGGTNVPAGSYAYFVQPNKEGAWTVIINKDYLQGGAFKYSKDLDVARAEVKPEPIAERERLAYIVANMTNDSATLDLEWEKVRLSLPIKLNTDAQVAANLKAVEDGADAYTAMANYERQIKMDYDLGLSFAEKSIRVKQTWQNFWAKAQLLAAKGKYKEALPMLERAISLGKDAPQFFHDQSTQQLADWKKK
jgi:hypothetical protein